MPHSKRISSFHQSSKPGLFSDQDLSWASPAIGGEAMVWNYSNGSTNSARSNTSSTSYYSVSSPTTTMSFDSASSPSRKSFRSNYTTTFSDRMESSPDNIRSSSTPLTFIRSTPSSLGWLPDTKLWKLYKFVVTKGKEPYLELLPDYVCTNETPERVYLDHQPKNPRKNTFPCQFPGGCSGKRVFSRPADLDRHYKNVHASVDQKDCFPCDYGPCARSKEPFTRKDHYRDHLKDFHKEDLGSAKAGKVEKGSAKWLQMQEAWLKERRISAKSWRCARCLGRVRVEEQGWVCGRCGVECERHRIEAREELRRREESEKRKGMGRGGGSGSNASGSTSVSASVQGAQDLAWSYPEACSACKGTGLVDDMREEEYMACVNCQPAVSYGISDWGHSQYASGSNSYYG